MILASQEKVKMEGLGSTHSVPPSKFTNKNQLLKLGDCDSYTHSQFSSVQFSRSVASDFLQPHESQHARPPCPSPTAGVYSNSCPSSQWCHPAISSSVVHFSSCPQSLPASGSSPTSQLFLYQTYKYKYSYKYQCNPVMHLLLLSSFFRWEHKWASQGSNLGAPAPEGGSLIFTS